MLLHQHYHNVEAHRNMSSDNNVVIKRQTMLIPVVKAISVFNVQQPVRTWPLPRQSRWFSARLAYQSLRCSQGVLLTFLIGLLPGGCGVDHPIWLCSSLSPPPWKVQIDMAQCRHNCGVRKEGMQLSVSIFAWGCVPSQEQAAQDIAPLLT